MALVFFAWVVFVLFTLTRERGRIFNTHTDSPSLPIHVHTRQCDMVFVLNDDVSQENKELRGRIRTSMPCKPRINAQRYSSTIRYTTRMISFSMISSLYLKSVGYRCSRASRRTKCSQRTTQWLLVLYTSYSDQWQGGFRSFPIVVRFHRFTTRISSRQNCNTVMLHLCVFCRHFSFTVCHNLADSMSTVNPSLKHTHTYTAVHYASSARMFGNSFLSIVNDWVLRYCIFVCTFFSGKESRAVLC